MNMKKLVVATLLGLAALSASAETSQEAAIKKLIEPQLMDGAKVDSVTKTPYGNLYEVRTNGDIIYTDAQATFLILGNLIDLKTRQNITRARLDELNKIKFSDLPLELAMKAVKGNGKRVMAVFEDPNCGYCKRFRQNLQEVDNVTIYTFMYNILAEDSIVKSKNIWCSSDANKAWDDWMLNNKTPATAPASCNAPHEKVLALGQKLKITGTPTIIFADGSRIPGAVDAKGLEKKFASIK